MAPFGGQNPEALTRYTLLRRRGGGAE